MGDNPSQIRRFTIQEEPSCERTITIKITEPALRAQGLALETWASSHVLSRQLHRLGKTYIPIHPERWTRHPDVIPALELGAGTGLVGLSAHALWSIPIVLTDLEPIVPGLAANVALNCGDTEAKQPSVACGTLDWNQPKKLTLSHDESGCFGAFELPRRAQIILAADTVYSEEHPELLCKVIGQWLLKNADARIIICYPMRVAYLDEIRDLWTRFEESGLEAIAEGRDTANEQTFDDECLCEYSVWKWRDDMLEIEKAFDR